MSPLPPIVYYFIAVAAHIILVVGWIITIKTVLGGFKPSFSWFGLSISAMALFWWLGITAISLTCIYSTIP